MADVQNAPNNNNPLVNILASLGLGEVAKRIGSSLSMREQGRLGMAIGCAGEQYRIGLKHQAAERIQSALKAPVFLKATGEKKNVAFMRGSNPHMLKRYVHMGTKPSRGGRIVDKLGRDID